MRKICKKDDVERVLKEGYTERKSIVDLTEKLVQKKDIFKGKIISMHVDEVILPSGNKSTREIVEHPGGVCVAALTDKDELLFVRQYRHPYKKEVLELPAGKLEPFLSPLENAVKELKEETGATGHKYYSLGTVYPSPGYLSEIIYLYFCRVKNLGEQNADEDEFLEVQHIKLSEALKLVMENKIPDAKTQIAVLKTSIFLKNGFI